VRLTASGDAIAQCAELVERQVNLANESLGAGHGQYAGSVKLTFRSYRNQPAIGSCNRKIAGQASSTSARAHCRQPRPDPVTPCTIGTLQYSVHAARSCSVEAAAGLPWITHDDSLAHLPQAKWIAKAASGSAKDIYRHRVHDARTAMESVLAGLGKTLPPTVIGAREPRLQRLETDARSPLPLREMWLLAHADQTDLARIVTVWLENVVMTATKK
jgi:hypothetical protein